jgi:integrase
VFYHSCGDGPIRWLAAASKRIRERTEFHFVPHDLRRTVGTNLAILGADRLTIGKALNHKSVDNTVTTIYDRYRREPEIEAALNAWSDRLMAIVTSEEESGKVVGRIA